VQDAVRDAGKDERLTVAEAAERLGITKEAVRKRIHRGTIRSDKDQDGTVRVYISPSDTASDTASATTSSYHHELLYEELHDRIAYLERQVEAERQGHAEARRLLLSALEKIPAIEAPSEPPSDSLGAPDSAMGEQRGRGSAPYSGSPQSSTVSTERRSWWRTFFGFE
jgi:excisionase family DNA binding protein